MPVYAAYNGKKELGAADFNAGVAAVAARSDVVLLSECEKKYQVDGTQALTSKGHAVFWPQTVAGRPVVHPANNEPIIWRPPLFDVLAGSKRSVLGLKGEAGRWPHRYVNSLILIEKATGLRAGILGGHTPARGYTHPNATERAHRRGAWDRFYAVLLAETKRLAALCDYVVGGADLNCPHELDPSGVRMVYAGATFEGKPYDALWTAGPVTVAGVHKLKTRSDHQAVIATITSPTTPEEPMATWRPAEALDQLRDEVNARWPGRSRASDGMLGDAKHASRTSDHNPWVRDGRIGVVTAIDITEDAEGGVPEIVDEIFRVIIDRRDPRVKYLIHEGKIWRSYDKVINGRLIKAWTPAPYNGLNGHFKHGHVSVKPEKRYYDSRAPWGIAQGTQGAKPTPPKEFTLSASQFDILKGLLEQILDKTLATNAAAGREEKAQTNADVDAIRADVAKILAKLEAKP